MRNKYLASGCEVGGCRSRMSEYTVWKEDGILNVCRPCMEELHELYGWALVPGRIEVESKSPAELQELVAS